jgi:MFS family permease
MYIVILINFLLAVATGIIMAITPLLITEKIGLSLFAFGVIEGSTEFLSNIFKLISGNIFDRIKNKKNIFILSTGFSALSKILLFFPNVFLILTAKTFERLSNGLFAAPRDAFVGQNAKNKGLALAFLNCSKTLGCIIGPLIVSLVVFFFGDLNSMIYQLILIGLIFTILAVILSFFIKANNFVLNIIENKLLLSQFLIVSKEIKGILIISLFFFLGRFNDGLIIIYLKKAGLPEWFYLSTIAFFNAFMFVAAPILGIIIDKNKVLLALYITIISLLCFNIVFYFVEIMPLALASIGLGLWGIQRVGAGITFTSLIFRNISAKFYGTAIGLFSLISGISNLISSSFCAYFAETSFDYVFLFSGINAILCLFISLIFIKKIKWKQ